jgi:fibronectin-binding autotransporter adhesin
MQSHKKHFHERFLFFAGIIGALVLVAGPGCGSDSTTIVLANSKFVGTLGNGLVLTLNFGTEASGSIPITGTLTKTGTTTINLTGTYTVSSAAIAATGTGYTLTGTQSGGVATGTYTGGGGSGSFAAFQGDATTVTVFCGTYAGGASGSWNLVKSGNSVAGAYSTGKLTNGTVSGASVNFSIVDSGGGTGTGAGTISGTAVSGTWTVGTATGTWTGNTTSC